MARILLVRAASFAVAPLVCLMLCVVGVVGCSPGDNSDSSAREQSDNKNGTDDAGAGSGSGDGSGANGNEALSQGGIDNAMRDNVQSLSEKNSTLTFESIPRDALMSVDELAQVYTDVSVELVDIRGLGTYSRGRIPGSLNIPAGRQIEIRFDEIDPSKEIVLVAQNTERVAEVRQTLIDMGCDASKIKVLDGGIDAWIATGLETFENPETGC